MLSFIINLEDICVAEKKFSKQSGQSDFDIYIHSFGC